MRNTSLTDLSGSFGMNSTIPNFKAELEIFHERDHKQRKKDHHAEKDLLQTMIKEEHKKKLLFNTSGPSEAEKKMAMIVDIEAQLKIED